MHNPTSLQPVFLNLMCAQNYISGSKIVLFLFKDSFNDTLSNLAYGLWLMFIGLTAILLTMNQASCV